MRMVCLAWTDVHSPSSRAGAAAVATALLLCTSVAAADATSGAQSSAETTVTSGSWAAVATTSNTAPYGSGPLALTFDPLGTSRQYFNVVNTGTLPLLGTTLTATTTASSAAIEACSTTWSESDGNCPSGVITTVTTTGAGPTPFSAPLPARIERLISTVRQGDTAAAMDAVLSLKVRSHMVGGLAMEQSCRIVQQCLSDGDSSSAVIAAQRVAKDGNALRLALEEFLQT